MLKAKELAMAAAGDFDIADDEEDRDTRVARVRNLFSELGVDNHSRDIINQYAAQAFKDIEFISVPDEKKAPLRDLATWLLNRPY